MSKFWLLFKVQAREALQGRSRQRKRDSGAGSERKKSRGGGGYTALLVVAAAIVVVFVCGIFGAMASAMHMIGQDSLTIVIGAVAGSALSLFTTIYETNGLLFGYRDYEMTMAMPVPTSTLVAIRLTLLYIGNLFFCAIIMVPAGVAYAMFANPEWTFWMLYIPGILLTPLLPTVLATIIGMLIAIAASRFERKGIMNIIFTIVFMVAYMAFVWNMDTVIESFAEVGPVIADVMGKIWPPGVWLAAGCCSADAGAYMLFAGVSIGVFAVYCIIVGKYFVNLNSMLSASREKRRFRMTEMSLRSQRKALLGAEISRLFSIEGYFMNCCIGYIICMVFAVIIAVVGPGAVLGSMLEGEETMGMSSGELLSVMAVFGICFLSMFMSIGSTTSVSISLEGNNLWILKTMPVSARDVLSAKRALTLVMGLPSVLVIGVCFVIAFPETPWLWALFFAEPLAFLLFSVMFGQVLNLKYPDLEWTSAVSVLKRSRAVMVLVFTAMGIGFVNMVLSLVMGPWVTWTVCAALFVCSWLLYSKLRTWGVEQFRLLGCD